MKYLVLTLVLGGSAAPALAWNGYGHMVVAAVAYDQLAPATRQRAAALLKLNPDYATWITTVPKAKRAKTAFVRAATWPDTIKSAPGYVNDGERPTDPNAAANIGYTDMLQHRYWHFVDLPFSPDGTSLVQPSVPNAQTQIAAFRAVLASGTATDALKSYDLVWLLHLVGDIHQPLHATSRFTQTQPQGDNGGNLVALCAHPCSNELHAFWDDVLGTSKSASAAIQRATTLAPATASKVAIQDELVWAQESLALAQSSVYSAPIGDGAGPYTLDGAYKTQAKQLARERIELAGERLAALLNDNLK
jgi:hypothetical protein